MILSKSIEKTVRHVIYDVTGLNEIDEDDSLISRKVSIAPANFLYIFDILEKKLSLPISDILSTHSFEVMTIKNLTNAIIELETKHEKDVLSG